MGRRTDRYPFGTFPYPPEEPWPEPLVVLAAIAGVTTRVRLSTGILIAPLRPAVLLAKTAATLDVLSGGRLDLGVGSGWQREEFWASGIEWADREQRLDDTVAACRVLWRDAPASFTSPTVSFADIWCRPAPLQPGGIPVWFGGGATERTARRIATSGDGWLPMAGMPVDEVASGIALVAEECARAGRDPAEVGVRAGLAGLKGPDGRPDVERTLEAAAGAGRRRRHGCLDRPRTLRARRQRRGGLLRRARARVRCRLTATARPTRRPRPRPPPTRRCATRRQAP